jgi:hypothetical protein
MDGESRAVQLQPLQARLEKRFSAGLTATMSYTFGKALTEAPTTFQPAAEGRARHRHIQEPQNGYNLGGPRLAEFDVKQRFAAPAP